MRHSAVLVFLLLPVALIATPAGHQLHAQTSAPAPASAGMPRPANDSLFRYARKLVLDGNGAAGRAIVDSLLTAAAPGSPQYGDALYWHGALASTLSDAERDYRRVIVEYPLAYYADDALLAIAELEQGRGDRAAALAHLQRFVHEHPASPARGIAALGAARLAFEQRDTKVACAMITEARASAGTADVELTNQIAYYSARCPAPPTTVAKMGPVGTKPPTPADTQSATKSGVPRAEPDPLPTPATAPVSATAAAVAAAAPPTPVRAPTRPAAHTPPPSHQTPRTITLRRDSAASARASSTHGRYTIQLAAYNTRAEAEEFIARIAKRGLKARVSGDAKPFRVRLDFYPTRSAAAAEVAALKARGIVGFVAEEGPRP